MKNRIAHKLFKGELIKLSDRHRALGRMRLVHPEWPHRKLAAASGYSLSRVRSIMRSRVFIEYLDGLHGRLDDQAAGVNDGILRGALVGVQHLVKVLTPGTDENAKATPGQRIKASIELLDRSGLAPKIKHTRASVTKRAATWIDDYLKEIIESDCSDDKRN